MSLLLIRDMDFPKCCNDCPLYAEKYDDHDEWCSCCLAVPDDDWWGCGYKIIDGIDTTKSRMIWCPIIELSSFDVELMNEIINKYTKNDSERNRIYDLLNKASTNSHCY